MLNLKQYEKKISGYSAYCTSQTKNYTGDRFLCKQETPRR